MWRLNLEYIYWMFYWPTICIVFSRRILWMKQQDISIYRFPQNCCHTGTSIKRNISKMKIQPSIYTVFHRYYNNPNIELNQKIFDQRLPRKSGALSWKNLEYCMCTPREHINFWTLATAFALENFLLLEKLRYLKWKCVLSDIAMIPYIYLGVLSDFLWN